MLPVSRFTQLASYVNRTENQSMLSSFRMFVILLHDVDDKPFADMLDRRFEALSELTGDNLLFFAFCHPHGVGIRMSSRADAVRSQFMSGSSRHLAAEMDYFCSMLNLDSHLPKLAISTDLNSESLLMVNFEADRLEGYLEYLTKIANIDDHSQRELKLKGFWLQAHASKHLLPQSLAVMLADMVAPAESIRSSSLLSSFAYDPKASTAVDKKLRKLEREINIALDAGTCIDNSEADLEHRRDALIDYNSLLRSAKLENLPHVESTDRYKEFSVSINDYPLLKYLSLPCLAILRMYNTYWIQVDQLINSEDTWQEDKVVQYDEQVIRLYRILSEIINCSLVQRLRWGMQIEMPQYYLQWKPNATAYIVTPQKNVKFNMRNDAGLYQAPTLGECRSAFEEVSKYSLDGKNLKAAMRRCLEPTPAFQQDFNSALNEIARCRNRIDHGVYCPSEEEFRTFLKAFRFILNNYLSSFIALQLQNSGQEL